MGGDWVNLRGPRKRTLHLGQCDLPTECEFFDKADWPPPWIHTRSPPRTFWDIRPCHGKEARIAHLQFLDSLHAQHRWNVYCDGSYVWKPDEVDTSKGGAGALIMHQEHLVEFTRLGLGSHTHSRDAELWALLAGAQMLNRITLPDEIKEIFIISDAALALRQLHKARPEPGHHITVQWHLAMNTFMNNHPDVRLAVYWGPSKSSHSLVLADELAKLSRCCCCCC